MQYGSCGASILEIKYRTLAKEGPWAVHLTLGQEWGGGPILEVSVSHLYAKERPGKLPMLAS